ncbi:hypothetical protein [Halovenus aranensis]|nr:hypothetical protein [Halovenus aranensis]
MAKQPLRQRVPPATTSVRASGSESAVKLATAEVIAEEGPYFAGYANENVNREQH